MLTRKGIGVSPDKKGKEGKPICSLDHIASIAAVTLAVILGVENYKQNGSKDFLDIHFC